MYVRTDHNFQCFSKKVVQKCSVFCVFCTHRGSLEWSRSQQSYPIYLNSLCVMTASRCGLVSYWVPRFWGRGWVTDSKTSRRRLMAHRSLLPSRCAASLWWGSFPAAGQCLTSGCFSWGANDASALLPNCLMRSRGGANIVLHRCFDFRKGLLSAFWSADDCAESHRNAALSSGVLFNIMDERTYGGAYAIDLNTEIIVFCECRSAEVAALNSLQRSGEVSGICLNHGFL